MAEVEFHFLFHLAIEFMFYKKLNQISFPQTTSILSLSALSDNDKTLSFVSVNVFSAKNNGYPAVVLLSFFSLFTMLLIRSMLEAMLQYIMHPCTKRA